MNRPTCKEFDNGKMAEARLKTMGNIKANAVKWTLLVVKISILLGISLVRTNDLLPGRLGRDDLGRVKDVGGATLNDLSAKGCLFDTSPSTTTEMGWRVAARAFIDASPVPSDEEIRQLPAQIFNLVNPSSHETTIYAIDGPKTAFAAQNRCRTDELPEKLLLFASGRPSKKPWFCAENVSLSQLLTDQPAREVLEGIS